LVVQFAAVLQGSADRTKALAMSGLILVGVIGSFVAIRSQWSLRYKDPALTLPQMLFAIVAISMAYTVNPDIRGIMPMLMALVLVFGAFILSPKESRRLGWMAVAALGGVMIASSYHAPSVFLYRIEVFNFVFSALVLPVIAALAGQLSTLRLEQQLQKAELKHALERVRHLASNDELTGLPNRRHVMELLKHKERKTLRPTAPLCCCLIDIDYFKRVNDSLGHQAGDETLRQFSRILSLGLRAGDVLARWGGEEFLLILPSTPIEEAAGVAQRLRERCANSENWVNDPKLQVTFSAGITAHVSCEAIDSTIARADALLYQAKDAGRDQVVVG
jgi:diguanylate cyclase (GGDEF)-like protein